jgi:hypothetical protein
VEDTLLKFIIKDMQKRISEKSQLNGLFQYAILVIMLYINKNDFAAEPLLIFYCFAIDAKDMRRMNAVTE